MIVRWGPPQQKADRRYCAHFLSPPSVRVGSRAQGIGSRGLKSTPQVQP